MKIILVIPLVAFAIIMAGTLAQPIAERWEDKNDYQRRLEAIQEQDYRYQVESTAASRSLVSNAAYPLALIAGAVVFLMLVDFYRQRREPTIRVEGLPVPRAAITSGDNTVALLALLADKVHASGIAQIEAARRVNTPAALNYSPHIEYIDSEQATPQAAPMLPNAAIEVVKPRDAWLAWLDEQPHTLLAGRTKAGKTWLATAILEQRLRAGEQVFIIDPHSSEWLGLPTAGSAANEKELGRALGAVLAEYLRRMQLRESHKLASGSELPHDHFGRLTVVIDEANAIAEQLPAQWKTVLKQLGSGSRKVGISLLLMAQSPLVEDLLISGGMRENFARIALDDRSVMLLVDSERDKPRQAALRAALLGMERPSAAQIGSQVWLLDRAGIAAGRAPAGARGQVWRGWDFATGNRLSIVSDSQDGNDVTTNGNDVTGHGNDFVTAPECGESVSGGGGNDVTMTPAELARIAQLLRSLPASEVAKKLDGYSPRRYAEYKARVDYVVSLLANETV